MSTTAGTSQQPSSVDPVTMMPGPPSGRSVRARLVHYAEAYVLVALTGVLILLFSVLPATRGTFPTVQNLQATIGNQSVLAILALAVLVPLVAQSYDFSVGATMGLSSIYAATALSHGQAIVVALLLAVAIGVLIGTVNGLLVTRARVSSLIATLGMATIIQGIVTWKTAGQSIVNGIPTSLTNFGSQNFLGIPWTVYVALLVAAGAHYVLRHTPFGRNVYALGSNRASAHLVGLRVQRLTLSTFVIAGALAGAVVVLQVARSGAGNPQVGPGFTLPALAAAFLSVVAIKPGRFNVWGAVVAIVFLAVLNSGLNLAGVDSYFTDFANGLALIVGVALAGLFGRNRTGSDLGGS
jgi:ribose transport system permease protein